VIYTFGRTSAYEEAFLTQTEVKKVGQQGDYPGGSVWRTREEAQAFVDSLPNRHCPDWAAADFSVYGVEADWDTDAYVESGAPWRSLKRDARLVKLV